MTIGFSDKKLARDPFWVKVNPFTPRVKPCVSKCGCTF